MESYNQGNMWKYFSANNMSYIDILHNQIQKYNNTYHQSIKCTPTFARALSNYQHVNDTLYNRYEDNDVEVKPWFKIGDHVHILKKKKTFEKGFTSNWTEELFIVSGVRLTKPVNYNIKDLKEETIKGAVYQQELQKANQVVYCIDKVLRKRKRNDDGTKEALVKWKGYSNNFNSWIPEYNIQKWMSAMLTLGKCMGVSVITIYYSQPISGD